MGGTGETLTLERIMTINRRLISEFGGIFFEGDNNLANPGSLDHVLAAIDGTLFGQELYTTLYEKAAAIGWRIIVGHVFHDGNKRTGMEACRLYLDLNGYDMRIDQEVVAMALKIATREIELADFVAWIEQRTTQRPAEDK
jgi:death-on-curing protein